MRRISTLLALFFLVGVGANCGDSHPLSINGDASVPPESDASVPPESDAAPNQPPTGCTENCEFAEGLVIDSEFFRVAVDSQGNTYALGRSQSGLTVAEELLPNQGYYDVLLIKYDPDMTPVWVLPAGSTGEDMPTDLTLDANDNIYMAAYYDGPFVTIGEELVPNPDLSGSFVTKVSPQGSMDWSIRAGGASYWNDPAIAVDKAGNVFVSGAFAGTVTIGDQTLTATSESFADGFVAKFAPGGDLLWLQQIRSEFYFTPEGIAIDKSGNPIVTGAFEAAEFGTTSVTSQGDDDMYVAKLSSQDGTFLWTRTAGGAEMDRGLKVAVDEADNIYVVGFIRSPNAAFGNTTLSSNDQNGFIAKLSPQGEFIWTSAIGSPDESNTVRGVVVFDDSICVVGDIYSGLTLGETYFAETETHSDILLARFSLDGVGRAAVRAGGDEEDRGRSIARHGQAVIVAGKVTGLADTPSGKVYGHDGGGGLLFRTTALTK